jgi:hypothetical protein
LRTRLGATRIESLGYATVPLPPELAFILGEQSTIINAYTLLWTSDISVELVRDLKRNRTVTLAYSKGQSPGNGVLLTSTQSTISAGYGARVFRRIPVNMSANYSSLDSISQGNIGHYNSETFSFGTSKALRHNASANVTIDYRRYDISGSPLLQHDLRISIGVSWSPPENSLRF